MSDFEESAIAPAAKETATAPSAEEAAAGRILLVGSAGMLGRDVLHALESHAVTGLTRADLDITDADAVMRAVEGHSIVVNCAANTMVDAAETNEALARAVNANGPANLAAACSAHGARMIQVSTDYVFDGAAHLPYSENAERNPVSAYGRTKAEGEWAVLETLPTASTIIRTAWLYGAHGPSFPKTMLRLAAERDTISVVTDQQGQPTWSRDLAARIRELVDIGVPAAILHGTNSGSTTWFGFAREIFQLSGLDPHRITATDSTAFVRPAPRPAYSVLGHEGWALVGLTPLRDWREAIAEAIAEGAFL